MYITRLTDRDLHLRRDNDLWPEAVEEFDEDFSLDEDDYDPEDDHLNTEEHHGAAHTEALPGKEVLLELEAVITAAI